MPSEADVLLELSLKNLPYKPLESQLKLLRELCEFATGHSPNGVFVLNGYAGTGKTSLVGALISAMTSRRLRTTVLAPTGRAAKVAEKYSARRASTIHRHIYHPEGGSASIPVYRPGINNTHDCLYIIDEASMVTDRGERSMLRDLIRFVYSAPGCAMILVGDTAQLPPVGQEDSPAMNVETLRGYGLEPIQRTLSEVARQAADSGILVNAHEVRRHIAAADMTLPKLTAAYRDVKIVPFYEFADDLSSSWSSVGEEETIIITRSNKRANLINFTLRSQILYADEPLMRGERLIVAKNNYFWTADMRPKSFLANGETIVLDWRGRTERRYGFNFVDAELRIPGNDQIISAKILIDSLTASGPAMPQDSMQQLFKAIYDEKEGSDLERTMAVLDDEYYNALQVKYAYCVTCHKAQGGQWKHVYIDLNSLYLSTIEESFFRWLYTALTRASEKVYFLQPSIPVAE